VIEHIRFNSCRLHKLWQFIKLTKITFNIFTDTKQVWEPKSSTKRLDDGTLVSPPLEDLAPFLPREELKKQMFIPLMDEE